MARRRLLDVHVDEQRQGDLAFLPWRPSKLRFEGRQGKNAKSHLMGPAMAAAAAVTGRLSDVRQLG